MHSRARLPAVTLLVLLLAVTAIPFPSAQAQGAEAVPALLLDMQDPDAAMPPGSPRILPVTVSVACPLAAHPDGAQVNLTVAPVAGLAVFPPAPLVVKLDPTNPTACDAGYVRAMSFLFAYPEAGTPAGSTLDVAVTATMEPAFTAQDSTTITVAYAGNLQVVLRGPTAPVKPGETFNVTADVTYRYNGAGRVNFALTTPPSVVATGTTGAMDFEGAPAEGTLRSHVFTLTLAEGAGAGQTLLSLDAKVTGSDGVEMTRVFKASTRVSVADPPAPTLQGETKDSPAGGVLGVVLALGLVAVATGRRR